MVADDRSSASRRARRPDGVGPRLPDGRRAAGRRAPRLVHLPLRQSAGHLSRSDRRAAPGGIVPVAAPRAQAGALHLPPEHRPVHPGAAIRARDQGRAPLDHARRLRHPAVRIRQADFRHPHRLGVLGGRAAQRHAGSDPRAAAPARDHRAARAAARFRPDRAPDHRLVLHAVRRRLALVLAARPRRARRRRGLRRLRAHAARARPHRALPRQVVGRHVSRRHRHGSLRQGRLARQRPRRRQRQAHPSRRSHRFHLRGDGGRVRHRRVLGGSVSSSPSSSCAASFWRGATRMPFPASR